MTNFNYNNIMTKYIAIDGMSGSGKTYLSDLLAQRLSAEVLHLDDYGNDFEPFIGLTKLFDKINQSKAKIIIYEGVGVFGDELNNLKPFRILVKSNDDIRNERLYNRDALSPKHTKDEWVLIGKIWEDVENKYFDNSLDNKADLIIENNNKLDIDFVISKL